MGHHISHIRQKQHRTRAARRQRGFTLIEVMVVIAILGILAALVVPKIMSRPDQARRLAAKHDIQTIAQALKLYRLDNGPNPTREQGLPALSKNRLSRRCRITGKTAAIWKACRVIRGVTPINIRTPAFMARSISSATARMDNQAAREMMRISVHGNKIPECRVYAARSADHTGHCRITHITGELSHLAQSAH